MLLDWVVEYWNKKRGIENERKWYKRKNNQIHHDKDIVGLWINLHCDFPYFKY